MVPGKRVASDGLPRAYRHRAAGLAAAYTGSGPAHRSRRQDLNLRPPAPRAGALPSAPRLAVVVLLVGSDGFEPPASSSRTRRATKLRYDPLAGRLSPTVRDGALDRSRSGGWVPTEGVEPPRPCGHTVLNRARLPVPPGRHEPAGGVARRGRWLIVRRDGARRLACSHSVVLKEPVDGSRSYPRGDSNPQSHRVWAGGMCLFCYSGWWAAREGVEPPHRAVTGRRTAGCATWHRWFAGRSIFPNRRQAQGIPVLP